MATGLFSGVALALTAVAHSVPTLLAGAAAVGLVYETPRTVLGAAITELISDPQQRAKIDALRFNWLSISASIAGAAGGLIAGWINISALYWINGAGCGVRRRGDLLHVAVDAPQQVDREIPFLAVFFGHAAPYAVHRQRGGPHCVYGLLRGHAHADVQVRVGTRRLWLHTAGPCRGGRSTHPIDHTMGE